MSREENIIIYGNNTHAKFLLFALLFLVKSGQSGHKRDKIADYHNESRNDCQLGRADFAAARQRNHSMDILIIIYIYMQNSI